MNYIKLGLLPVFFFVCLHCFGQSISNTKKIETLIKGGIDKAFETSVYIAKYDTITKKADIASSFSGVVVSAEGHILTVSHAAQPEQVYLITFTDGAKHVAKGFGRISIRRKGNNNYDMAMLKILKHGKWPFAKMGRSSIVKVNQPAISISYPGAFDKPLPNVRVGRITNVDFTKGLVESTCKMEPGDSGGPLFDINGQVIGIHSWIQASEDQNFDVPIDVFHKYWSALNVAKNYRELPDPDKLQEVEFPKHVVVIADLQAVPAPTARLNNTVVRINSVKGDEQLNISGTIINFSSASRKRTCIVSKSSMVGDHPWILLSGKNIAAKIVARDKDCDLVVLAVSENIGNGIKLQVDQKDLDLGMVDLGNILFSPIYMSARKVGVLSSEYVDMPLAYSRGFFGADATFIDQKITITKINKGSAAAKFVKLKDQITAINRIPISKPAEYGAELAKYMAGDSINIDAVRDGAQMQFKMLLPPLPPVEHITSAYSGGRSARSDGFKKVIVQDAAIRFDECGGPVFGRSGEFYGINIARHSRTSTIIMPVGEIAKFLATASF